MTKQKEINILKRKFSHELATFLKYHMPLKTPHFLK